MRTALASFTVDPEEIEDIGPPPPATAEDTLGTQILLAMPLDRFWRRFEKKVQDPARETVLRTLHEGGRSYFYLRGGYVVLENEKGLWSFFETAEKTAERKHFESWAAFARGFWTLKTPTKPGLYATKDLHDRRQDNRKLIGARGGVLDVSGGFVRAGRSTEWVGFWWSEPFPPLPNSI